MANFTKSCVSASIEVSLWACGERIDGAIRRHLCPRPAIKLKQAGAVGKIENAVLILMDIKTQVTDFVHSRFVVGKEVVS